MQNKTSNYLILCGLALAAFGLFSARSIDLSLGKDYSGSALAYYKPEVTAPAVGSSVKIEAGSSPSSTPFQPAKPIQPPLATRNPAKITIPTSTPVPTPAEAPTRLEIPVIDLDVPVEEVSTFETTVLGEQVTQWRVPDAYLAGWHSGSALLGEGGNTVLNGHHNIHGEVFGNLKDVNLGDEIWVTGATYRYRYVVVNKMVLPEKYQDLDIRMENAAWILPSEDERLTLITCWPQESNTHRLILVARPAGAAPVPSPAAD